MPSVPQRTNAHITAFTIHKQCLVNMSTWFHSSSTISHIYIHHYVSIPLLHYLLPRHHLYSVSTEKTKPTALWHSVIKPQLNAPIVGTVT